MSLWVRTSGNPQPSGTCDGTGLPVKRMKHCKAGRRITAQHIAVAVLNARQWLSVVLCTRRALPSEYYLPASYKLSGHLHWFVVFLHMMVHSCIWSTSWLHLTIIVPQYLCFWSVRVMCTGDMVSYSHCCGTHVSYSWYRRARWLGQRTILKKDCVIQINKAGLMVGLTGWHTPWVSLHRNTTHALQQRVLVYPRTWTNAVYSPVKSTTSPMLYWSHDFCTINEAHWRQICIYKASICELHNSSDKAQSHTPLEFVTK